MTENDNQPPVPSKQTSSVPLKKETVRVTLKAADAPPAVPSATVPMTAPMTAPVRPPVPGVPPTPTAPTPTIPLRPVGAPTSTPAPTIRLATSSATSALRPGGGGIPTLPKATVQLQAPTQPLGASFAPTPGIAFRVEEEEEEDTTSGLVKIMAGLGFAVAVGVLICQLLIANIWIGAEDPRGEDSGKAGDWARIIE